MITKAKVMKGNGLAHELGFPTINLHLEAEECGVFIVDEVDHGLGVAFVMPNLTEIHFFEPIEDSKECVEYETVYQIEPPENGILDYFYKGLKYDKTC